MRSFTRRERVRDSWRASSCSSLGTTTARAAVRRPSSSASTASTSCTPSIRSVLLRRPRWFTAMLAGSSTQASIPAACIARYGQNPSRPAS